MLWAVFERDTDGQISSHITDIEMTELTGITPELQTALTLLGLSRSTT